MTRLLSPLGSRYEYEYEYEATHVGYDDENDTLTVAFGGLPDADNYPTISLMLQRSTDEDEDEAGIEGVYVEWCDQGMSGYGCISKFVLQRHLIEVTFNDKEDFYLVDQATPSLTDKRIDSLQIKLSLAEGDFVELKDRLTKIIFADCPELELK